MALEKRNKNNGEGTFSLNHVDPSFYNKIMSRKSSVGHSNRSSSINHSTLKVLLDWEVQPGTPRDIPTNPPIESNKSESAISNNVINPKNKKPNLDMMAEEQSSATTLDDDDDDDLASDEFIDFDFLNSDVGGDATTSSSPSSPSALPTPTCAIKPPKLCVQYMARGLVKWVFAKPGKKTK